MGGPSLVTPGINCSTTTRCVRGSTLDRYFFTKVSFTTATGTPPAASCSVNVRPVIMRMPNVRKYSGVTILKPAPGREEGSSKVCADDGHAGGSGDRGDSGKGADLIDELAVKSVVQFGFGKPVVGDGQIKREDVVLPESEIHAGQLPETVYHEACASKEREGQCKLDDDQSLAQTLSAGGTGRGAPGFFQGVAQIELRGLPCRRAAEQHSTHD